MQARWICPDKRARQVGGWNPPAGHLPVEYHKAAALRVDPKPRVPSCQVAVSKCTGHGLTQSLQVIPGCFVELQIEVRPIQNRVLFRSERGIKPGSRDSPAGRS